VAKIRSNTPSRLPRRVVAERLGVVEAIAARLHEREVLGREEIEGLLDPG